MTVYKMIGYLIGIGILIGIVYLILSLIALSFDVREWNIVERIILGLWSVLLIFKALVMAIEESDRK